MQLCNVKMEVAGLFRIEKFKTDKDGHEVPGSRKVAADWFPNLILDQGLNTMATSASYLNACQVGTGSTPPAEGQTALSSLLAGTTTRPSNTTSTSASAPYYVAQTITFRFAEGAVVGNIAEVGVGTATTGTTLFSRSLIKDGSGNPTTITILADESLDVIYQFRYYAPETDVTGTIVATGNIGGTYDYKLRAANVTSTLASTGWTLPTAQNGNGINSSGYAAFTGTIGAVTAGPSGTSGAMTAPTALSYMAGSFFLDRVVTASAAQANLAGGVRSMILKLGIGTYQIQFDPAIPKTSTDVVQLTLRLNWSRRP